MILEPGFAAMQPRDFANQREAEAGAFAAGGGAGEGVEAVEELGEGVVGGAAAVVAEADFDVAVGGA